jgi:hypothetical protein
VCCLIAGETCDKKVVKTSSEVKTCTSEKSSCSAKATTVGVEPGKCSKTSNVQLTSASSQSDSTCKSACSKDRPTLAVNSSSTCHSKSSKTNVVLTANVSDSVKSCCSKKACDKTAAGSKCPEKAQQTLLNVVSNEKFCHKTAVALLTALSQIPAENHHAAINAYLTYLQDKQLNQQAQTLQVALQNFASQNASTIQTVDVSSSGIPGVQPALVESISSTSGDSKCCSKTAAGKSTGCQKPCVDDKVDPANFTEAPVKTEPVSYLEKEKLQKGL